jgi:starch synthase (maltosyl-transferring)
MAMSRTFQSIIIEHVHPELDAGRYPVKRPVGEQFEVGADIFKEGHDVVDAVLKYRTKRDPTWRETPMRRVDNDRWMGSFRLEENTRYRYTIEAFLDPFRSWVAEITRKAEFHQDVASELLEGQGLVRRIADRVAGPDRDVLLGYVRRLEGASGQPEAVAIAREDGLLHLMTRHVDRSNATLYERELEVVVDRPLAIHAAWYEMFARSQGAEPERSATFEDCEARLPEIRSMGFDVVYLAPIHPIGSTNRKGRNNTPVAGPDDPGSPWAIGAEEGGHKAVDPGLGTLDDFDRFVDAVKAQGMEVALDLALQCSADHPYLREHPEWFAKRPDGTIKYAENPPKKYQDIYPLDFYCEDWEALWEETKSIVLHWISHGVRIFRVDNPHTKPVGFWEWLIREVQEEHPEVIFLSEAFTRPKMMRVLAKAGFTQSYTYFTWRNFKQELIDYFTELTQSEMREYFRGNLFTNTPDILPEILQQGGRPAFKLRLVLAATLSSLYGIYNGYELCENRAIPGTEEYLNSEKYEHKVWDWERPGHIKDYIARLNRIRRENAALHLSQNLRFYPSEDDNILFYGTMTPEQDNVILVAVNLDPFAPHESVVHVPLAEIGLAPDETYQMHELITDTRHLWKGTANRISLDPAVEPAAIFAVRRWRRREQDFDYYF